MTDEEAEGWSASQIEAACIAHAATEKFRADNAEAEVRRLREQLPVFGRLPSFADWADDSARKLSEVTAERDVALAAQEAAELRIVELRAELTAVRAGFEKARQDEHEAEMRAIRMEHERDQLEAEVDVERGLHEEESDDVLDVLRNANAVFQDAIAAMKISVENHSEWLTAARVENHQLRKQIAAGEAELARVKEESARKLVRKTKPAKHRSR